MRKFAHARTVGALNLVSTTNVGRRTVVNGWNFLTGWADVFGVDAAVGGIEHSSHDGRSNNTAGFLAASISAQGLVSSAALGDWAVASLVGARSIRASQSLDAEALSWLLALKSIINAFAFTEDLAFNWAGNSGWASIN